MCFQSVAELCMIMGWFLTVHGEALQKVIKHGGRQTIAIQSLVAQTLTGVR
jgi:hypothetical protein